MSSPSQAPTRAASTVSTWRARRTTALLAQHDLLGVLGARRAVRLLAEVRARDQPGGPSWSSLELAQRGRAREDVGDLGADRLLDVVAASPRAGASGSAPLGPAQVDPAEADRLDALLVEPGQPGVVALVVVRRRRAARRP